MSRPIIGLRANAFGCSAPQQLLEPEGRQSLVTPIDWKQPLAVGHAIGDTGRSPIFGDAY